MLNADAFVLRYFASGGDDLILIVNLGMDFALFPTPEPLLAAPLDRSWHLRWSSESPVYGGGGTPAVETTAG